jgi:hypothetical protein
LDTKWREGGLQIDNGQRIDENESFWEYFSVLGFVEGKNLSNYDAILSLSLNISGQLACGFLCGGLRR